MFCTHIFLKIGDCEERASCIRANTVTELLLLFKLKNEVAHVIATWPLVSKPISWTSTYWSKDHPPTLVLLQCIKYCAQFLQQLETQAVHWKSLHRHCWNTYKKNISDAQHYTAVLTKAKAMMQQPHVRQHTARWQVNLIYQLYLMTCFPPTFKDKTVRITYRRSYTCASSGTTLRMMETCSI